MKISQRSKRFALSLRDFFKGAIIALTVSVLTFISQSAGLTDLTLKQFGYVCLVSLSSYLLTKFAQDENGNISKKI